MTTKCSSDCYPVCDFCTHYAFNGNQQGVYLDKGKCKITNKRHDPEDGCKRYHCFRTLNVQKQEKHIKGRNVKWKKQN